MEGRELHRQKHQAELGEWRADVAKPGAGAAGVGAAAAKFTEQARHGSKTG